MIGGSSNLVGIKTIQALRQKFFAVEAESSLKELKLIGCRVTEKNEMNLLMTDMEADFDLESLTLSQLGFQARHIDSLNRIIANGPRSLIHLDLAWLQMRSKQLSLLL